MNTYDDKSKKKKNQLAANDNYEKGHDDESTFQFVDNRPIAIEQKKIIELANNAYYQKQRNNGATFQFVDNRPIAIEQKKIIELANNAYYQKQRNNGATFQFVDNKPEIIKEKKLQEPAHNSLQTMQTAQFQAKTNIYSAQQQNPIQKKKNNTGLPDNLKTGMENLSGVSLDDVKVHRNSDEPAQLNAHAYAQGTDIHLASGQEKQLPHETWHVVQQKQGRVKPTMQMKGKININDDKGLEKEADVMGAKALQQKKNPLVQGFLTATKEIDSSLQFQQLKSHSSVTQLIGGPKKRQVEPEKEKLIKKLQKSDLLDDNDKKLIEEYVNTYDNDFLLEDIEFLSMHKDEEGNNKIGSIYFKNGNRIRLSHGKGPKNELSKLKMVRYAMLEENIEKFLNYFLPKGEGGTRYIEDRDIGYKQYINEELKVKEPAKINDEGFLFEVPADNGSGRQSLYHHSRGKPVGLKDGNLTQEELNILVNVIKDNKDKKEMIPAFNEKLKNWMEAAGIDLKPDFEENTTKKRKIDDNDDNEKPNNNNDGGGN